MGEDQMLLRVTDIYYEDENDLVVKLIGRSRDGRRIVKDIFGTEPYMFVPEAEPDPRTFGDIEEQIVDVRYGYESFDGVRLQQIVTHVPKDITDVRDKYDKENRYEPDLVYERRCTADYGLSGYVRVPEHDSSIHISDVEDVETEDVDDPIDPRVCIVDIEARAPDQFYDDFAKDAPNEVTAVTVYDSYEEEYTLFCLDPDYAVDPGQIREHIRDHWQRDGEERYAEAPITFKRYLSETALLKEFIKHIQSIRPDVWTGWNFVDFDAEYLVNRIRSNDDLNVHALSDVGMVGGWQTSRYVPGLPAVDMMQAMQKVLYGNKESWSLDYISHDMLGVGKVAGEDNSYDEDRSMFMAYNVVDVQLCVALDEAQALMQFWYQIADICSIPIYAVGSTMKECEGYLFKHRNHSEILPATESEELDDISGGFVMPPSDGIREHVGVVDLKSLYPSSIITCNISKETMTRDPDEADIVIPDMPLNYEEVPGDEITWDDIGFELGEGSCVGFTLDSEGVLPKYLKNLFEERRQKKELRDQYGPDDPEYDRYDNQQRAVKVIMNSFFGVSDNPHFRLSAEGMGGAITGASRFVQWYGVQCIEEDGYDVIYGDTDSLMVSMADASESVDKQEIVNRGQALEGELNRRLSPISDEFGIPEQHPFVDVAELPHELPDDENHLWQYEFEKLYRRFFQAGSKKRYAGWVVWKEGKDVDAIDTTGLESIRSDSPAITEHIQERFIELVLKDKGFEELTAFIQDEIAKMESGDYMIGDFAKPGSYNPPYKQTTLGQRAVEYTNEYVPDVEFQVGDDPWIVYVDGVPQGVKTHDVIALSWTAEGLPRGFELDSEQHAEKAIWEPLSDIIEETGYTKAELKTGKQEQSVVSGGGTPSFDDDSDDRSVRPEFGEEEDSQPKQSSAFDW